MGLYVIQTNAVPGREAEYNDWYDNQHLHDVLSVPGFVAAQRFCVDPLQRDGRPTVYPFQYLALYETEGDSPAALSALSTAVQAGMYLSPAMAEAKHAVMYHAITDRRLAQP